MSVPAAARGWEADEPATANRSAWGGLGLFAAAFLVAGVVMLHHARTADPNEQPSGYRAWKWAGGGIVCLGSGIGLGWLALSSGLDS